MAKYYNNILIGIYRYTVLQDGQFKISKINIIDSLVPQIVALCIIRYLDQYFTTTTFYELYKGQQTYLSPIFDFGLGNVLDGHLQAISITYAGINDAKTPFA